MVDIDSLGEQPKDVSDYSYYLTRLLNSCMGELCLAKQRKQETCFRLTGVLTNDQREELCENICIIFDKCTLHKEIKQNLNEYTRRNKYDFYFRFLVYLSDYKIPKLLNSMSISLARLADTTNYRLPILYRTISLYLLSKECHNDSYFVPISLCKLVKYFDYTANQKKLMIDIIEGVLIDKRNKFVNRLEERKVQVDKFMVKHNIILIFDDKLIQAHNVKPDDDENDDDERNGSSTERVTKPKKKKDKKKKNDESEEDDEDEKPEKKKKKGDTGKVEKGKKNKKGDGTKKKSQSKSPEKKEGKSKSPEKKEKKEGKSKSPKKKEKKEGKSKSPEKGKSKSPDKKATKKTKKGNEGAKVGASPGESDEGDDENSPEEDIEVDMEDINIISPREEVESNKPSERKFDDSILNEEDIGIEEEIEEEIFKFTRKDPPEGNGAPGENVPKFAYERSED